MRSSVLPLSLILASSNAFMLAIPRATTTRPPRTAVSAAADIRNAGATALAAFVLVSSPMAAHAKGGGHGGGGGHSSGGHSSYHSSSHSSSSSSSRRTLHSYGQRSAPRRRSSRRSSAGYRSSYSSSHAYASSPPSPPLLFPDEGTARREAGYYCPADLPQTGEHVDVAGEGSSARTRAATVVSSVPATQTSLYGRGGATMQPVPGFESDCTVTVRYDDDGTTATVSAAEKPLPLWAKYLDVALLGGYSALGLAGGGSSDGSNAWAAAVERHEELIDELGKRARPTPPPSGEYWGSSEESDEGDQAVRSTLRFGAGGKVTGRGTDGVDGAYRITQGAWGGRAAGAASGVELGWIEEYDEGFRVAVRGRYDAADGTIKARFTSSRGVSGTFVLAPKPSIF